MRRIRAFPVFLACIGALVAGEAWWNVTTPSEDEVRCPNAYEFSNTDFFLILRRDRPLARRIGYSEATERADWALLKAGDATSKAIQAKKQAMTDAGASKDAVYRYQRRAEAWAKAHHDPRLDRLPSLTDAQKAVLLPRVVRRWGPQCLPDREVAAAVGLDEAGRLGMERRIVAAQIEWHAENDAAGHARYVLAGASPKAIESFDEANRLFRRTLAGELDRFDPAVSQRLNELEGQASYKTPGFLVSFVTAHRDRLATRRKAAILRQMDARMIAALTPAQRTRWDALRKG